MSLIINTVKKRNYKTYAKLQRKAQSRIELFDRIGPKDSDVVQRYWSWVSGFCEKQKDRYRT